MEPIVAIIGRANVGKSTLFNRLLGKSMAIVEDLPGTTRDRIFADTLWQGQRVTLVDTGGLEPSPGSSLAQKVTEQAQAAVAEADVIIFLVDVRDGVISSDREIADLLRSRGKPIVLAVNKVDNPKLESQIADFYQLGISAPLAISAYHGREIDKLTDVVTSLLPQPLATPVEPEGVRVAIVGRPNVGKSTLLNAILGKERAIVDDVPGTTRDAIDSFLNYDSQQIWLIDTAGIKRRGRVGTGVNYYSLIRALRAINRCDVALLLIDAAESITAQDIHIAGYIKEALKGMVLVVNKWDLVSEKQDKEYSQQIGQRLKFMPQVPILYVSAKLGQGVDKVLPQALQVWQERQKQLPDPVINTLIKEAVIAQAPPRVGLKRLEIIRAYQAGVNPPRFIFMVNDPKLIHFSYHRYLENKLRQTFGFSGTPLQLIFKKAPKKQLGRVR